MKAHKVRYKILSVLAFIVSCFVIGFGTIEGGMFLLLVAIYFRLAAWEEERM